MDVSYRLELLGRVQLLRDDQPVESLTGHRHKLAVLAYLALQPRGRSPRDRLVHWFWPDGDEAAARHSLSQLLSEIRKELGETLELTPDTVGLVPGSFECDAVEFESAAESGDWVRAADLYGGALLQNLPLSTSLELEHWLEGERARLRRVYRKVCGKLIARLRAQGALDEAIARTRRWLDLDPSEDEAHHNLIDLLYAMGDRAGALQQFDLYRKSCAEMDVEPLEATLALVEQIRSGEGVAPAATETRTRASAEPPARPEGAEVPARALAPPPGMLGGAREWVLRARSAGLARALIVYVVSSWVVLQAAGLFGSQFGLPRWFFPASVAVLVLCLPLVIATALIQTGPAAHPTRRERVSRSALTSPRSAARRWLTWRRSVLGALLAVAGLSALGLGHIWRRNRGLDLETDVVAVLPFHVVGDGVELWREGLVDLLAMALDGTGQFRASDPRAVLNRWRKSVGTVEELPEPEVAAEVAGSLRAGRMILGSVIRTGPHSVRVAAELYSVRWLRKLASAAVEGPEDDITTLTDRLTVDLLKEAWTDGKAADVRVSAITTTSIHALRAYLEGEQAFRRSQFVEAQHAFTRAVEADSIFVVAWYRLALAYGWHFGAAAAEVPRYLVQAERHSEGLPERDRLLILGHKLLYVDGDIAAIPLFGNLASRYPDDVEAWYGLGEALFHIGSLAGNPMTAAVEPFERAWALDASFAPALLHLIEVAYFEGDSTRGSRWTHDYLALDSTSLWAQSYQLLTPLLFGPPSDSTAAANALDTAGAVLLSRARGRLRGPGPPLPLFEQLALAAAHPRFPKPARGTALWDLGVRYLQHGRIADAVDAIQRAIPLSAGDLEDDALYLFLTVRGLGLASDSASLNLVEGLTRKLAYPAQSPWLARQRAREGRLREAQVGLAYIDRAADSMVAAGDSVSGRSVQGAAWVIRAYMAEARGHEDSTIAYLQRAIPMMNPMIPATPMSIRDLERYYLATALEERGDEEEALSIYGSLYWTPWLEALGYWRRAELHDRRGERAEALRYYALFLKLWASADAPLQPAVQSARQAIERLAREPVTPHPPPPR